MTHEIRLYDQIGEWGITAEAIAAQVPADADSITVRINSPGGAVADGIAMYHYLKDHAAHITTIVDGYAASAASLVMLAGDVREVHAASIVMIHNPWRVAVGDADELRKAAAVSDTHREALLDIYEARTGLDREQISDLLDDETWMRGEAAVANGFADSLIDEQENTDAAIAAQAPFARLFAALQEGNEIMSTQKTRKEIQAELDAAQATITTLESAAAEATSIHDAQTEQIADQAEAITAGQTQIAELEAAAVTAQEAQMHVEKERDDAMATIETMKAEAVASADEIETLKATLADPRYADANLTVHDEAVPGADADAAANEAEAEAQQAAAEAEAGDSQAPHYDAFVALKDAGKPALASAYFKEHEADIHAEQRALIAAEAAADKE